MSPSYFMMEMVICVDDRFNEVELLYKKVNSKEC